MPEILIQFRIEDANDKVSAIAKLKELVGKDAQVESLKRQIPPGAQTSADPTYIELLIQFADTKAAAAAVEVSLAAFYTYLASLGIKDVKKNGSPVDTDKQQ